MNQADGPPTPGGDANGAPDGTRLGSKTGTGTADGQGAGSGNGRGGQRPGTTSGSGSGTATGDRRRPGGTGQGGGRQPGQEGGERPTVLDRITRVAGILDLPVLERAGSSAGGLPAASAHSAEGRSIQALYVIAVVISTVLLVGKLIRAVGAIAKMGLRAALRLAMRGLRRQLRKLWRGIIGFFAKGGRGRPTGLGRKLGASSSATTPAKSSRRPRVLQPLPVAVRRNRTATGAAKWSLEHSWIKQRWYRGANLPAWRAQGTRVNMLLRGIGDAGWNHIPVPHSLNLWLRNPIASLGFNTAVYGGGGYGVFSVWRWALSPLSPPPSATTPRSRPHQPANSNQRDGEDGNALEHRRHQHGHQRAARAARAGARAAPQSEEEAARDLRDCASSGDRGSPQFGRRATRRRAGGGSARRSIPSISARRSIRARL